MHRNEPADLCPFMVSHGEKGRRLSDRGTRIFVGEVGFRKHML